MSLCVLRVKNSGYFPPNFNEIERKLIGLDYALGDLEEPQEIILITNTDTSVEEVLEINEKHQVKLIIHPNSGYDNFSLELLNIVECPFILGNSIRANAVAEHIINCFSHYHSLSFQTSWNRNQKNSKRKLMEHSKVLVFGKGEIGGILDQKLRPLVNRLDFSDPYKFKFEYNLGNYNVIILACSLNQGNKKMINQDFLENIEANSIIINAARGGLIDWNVIDKFRHMTFYIDVFPIEPFDLAKYANRPNLFLTSHLAGCHESLVQNILDFEVKIIRDYKALDYSEFKRKYYKADIRRKVINGAFI